eukprot:g8603.t1
MASLSSRSQSARSLTIDDSFHREQQQRRWTNRGSRSRSSGRKLVRSNSVSSDYVRAAGTMPPSTSSSAPKQRGKGNKMLRSVVDFLSRTKSGGKGGKTGSFTMTEPASPSSASSLSRTNSDSSAHGVGREDGSTRIGADGLAGTCKPRVSFDAVVQTVYIEQMNEEEVRKTFYCRTEYAAFKEAYRTHRDTSTDWCRSNDVLPCNCDACQDNLADGGHGHHGHHIYSSARSTASAPAALSPDEDNDNYDNAFEIPPPPASPYALVHKAKTVCEEGQKGENNIDWEHSEPPSPYAYGHKDPAAKGGEGEGEGAQGHNAPPSPVGAVFHGTQEDSCSGSSSSSSGSSACSRASRSSCRSSSRATARKCPSSSRYFGAKATSHSAAHRRRGTWGVGSVRIASPVGKAHKRGGSLDDWGVSSSVQEAVKCHGEGYAYKTLRLQGFSDLYIRTHFLPEG